MKKIKLVKRKEKQRYSIYRAVLWDGGREVHTDIEVVKTREGLEKLIELLRLVGVEVEEEE